MKLIFIRHAEPDYTNDSLTEKGFREAALLAERTKEWPVTQFYCSPLGRAQATAAPTLHAHRVSLTTVHPAQAPDIILAPDPAKAIVYPWLREMHVSLPPEKHPVGKYIPWDFPPSFLQENPLLFDKERWTEIPLFASCDIKEQYDWVCNGLDHLLQQHGYTRNGLIYHTDATAPASDWFMCYDGHTVKHLQNAPTDEPVIVIFCHLGVMMTMLSHLINTSPFSLLHGVFVPPASVTVLSTEERTPGDAYFRIQTLGDTSHFRTAGEPVSYYGGFAAPFQM